MPRVSNLLPYLTREEMTPPFIGSVPPGIIRPRWSVMIPTYNCARFLKKTLQSVLSQDIDPAEMQIEVIDDCSFSDDPEAVVREYGEGRVSFYRKSSNAGAVANFNACIERSIGYYVHILHGDDFIKPGFYRTIEDRIEQYGNDIDLYVVRSLVVDEDGHLDFLMPRIKELESPSSDPSCLFLENLVRTSGCIIRRAFYEKHGGFLTALVHTADWEMWTRAIASGKGLFVNAPLAVYRFFNGNDTGRLAKSGENLRDHYRLSQVMADRYQAYPKDLFLKGIVAGAASQAARFEAMGDQEAAEANRCLLRTLNQDLPPDKRSLAKRVLKKLKSLIGSRVSVS